MSQLREPADFTVIQRLREILKNSDLTTLTRKAVREQLEQDLGCSLKDKKWKQKLKSEIQLFVQQQQQQNNDSDNSSNDNNIVNENNIKSSNNKSNVYNFDDHLSSNNNRTTKKRKLNNDRSDPTRNDNLNSGSSNNTGISRLAHKWRNEVVKRDSDGNFYMKFPQPGLKRFQISRFKGKVYVGLREFYERNGEEKPTKKGISIHIFI